MEHNSNYQHDKSTETALVGIWTDWNCSEQIRAEWQSDKFKCWSWKQNAKLIESSHLFKRSIKSITYLKSNQLNSHWKLTYLMLVTIIIGMSWLYKFNARLIWILNNNVSFFLGLFFCFQSSLLSFSILLVSL